MLFAMSHVSSQLDMTHVPVIEKCCDKHDLCYDTCNQPKETCDDEFRDCLTRICKAAKKHVSRDLYDGESVCGERERERERERVWVGACVSVCVCVCV